MRIGLSAYDIGATEFAALAVAADAAGFDSLWLGEHVVLPVGYLSEHPTAGSTTAQHHSGPIVVATTTLTDPFVALAASASLTERINLATGIFLLPLRHPIAVARSIATLQDLACGRFCFGVGAGWLEEEFRSLGVEFSERWSRLTEYVEAVRLLLSGDEVAFNGRYVTFDSVQLSAQPVEVPIVLGGNGAQALRRAARMADGWLSSGTPTLAEAEALRSELERACESVGRRTAMPQWYRARFVDSSSLDDHEARGFDQVVLWADQLWPSDGDLCSKRERFVQRVHDTGLSDRLGGGAIG